MGVRHKLRRAKLTGASSSLIKMIIGCRFVTALKTEESRRQQEEKEKNQGAKIIISLLKEQADNESGKEGNQKKGEKGK